MVEVDQGYTIAIPSFVRRWTEVRDRWTAPTRPDLLAAAHGSKRGVASPVVLLGLVRIAEAAGLAFAGLLSIALARRLGEPVVLRDWLVAVAFATVSALMVLRSGPSRRIERWLAPVQDAGTCFAAIILGMAIQGSSLFILDRPHVASAAAAAAATWAVAAGLSLLFVRVAIGLRLTHQAKAGRLTRRIAIVGANDASAAFIARSRDDGWTQIVGVFDDEPASRDPLLIGAPVRGGVDDLVLSSRQNRVDAVVLALPNATPGVVGALRQRLRSVVADVAVIAGSPYLSPSTGAITVLAGSPVVIVSRAPLQHWDGVLKTVFDRVCAGWLLVALAPLMLTIAALVKLDSDGPVLFRQQREGFNNTLFTIYKFRTMRHGRSAADEAMQATRVDRRITRVGALLRRLSLDELPQLLNVLRGDMSLVGPRPHLAATRVGGRLFHEAVPSYAARHRVKPGITGWAQVQGLRGETRTAADIADRVACDLDYIDRWSFWRDVQIMGMTARNEVFSRSGNAY